MTWTGKVHEGIMVFCCRQLLETLWLLHLSALPFPLFSCLSISVPVLESLFSVLMVLFMFLGISCDLLEFLVWPDRFLVVYLCLFKPIDLSLKVKFIYIMLFKIRNLKVLYSSINKTSLWKVKMRTQPRKTGHHNIPSKRWTVESIFWEQLFRSLAMFLKWKN